MIGILDSGIGGLSMVRMMSGFLSGYDMIFFGDTARGPYGNKSAVTIESFALQGFRFLIQRGAQVIVIACHDIASCAASAIGEKYPVDILDGVTPSVKEALAVSKVSRIGIIGTRATIDSGIYEKKIRETKPQAKVYSGACPLLVPIIEEGQLKKPEIGKIVKKYIQPLKVRQIDTLIAACSYYFSINEMIKRKTGKRIKVIDSSTALASYLECYLGNHPELDRQMSRKGRMEIFVSDLNQHVQSTAKRLYKLNCCLQQVNLSSW